MRPRGGTVVRFPLGRSSPGVGDAHLLYPPFCGYGRCSDSDVQWIYRSIEIKGFRLTLDDNLARWAGAGSVRWSDHGHAAHITSGIPTNEHDPGLAVTSKTEPLYVWCGIVGSVLMGVGMFVAKLLPPPAPNESAAQLAAFYRRNTTALRWSSVIMASGAPSLGHGLPSSPGD